MKCPRCQSEKTIILGERQKKKFGWGKAVVGTLVLGPLGVVAGAIGNKPKSEGVSWACQDCGHNFITK